MAKGYEDIALPVQNVTVNRRWMLYGVIAIAVVSLTIIAIPLLPKSLDDRINIMYTDGQNYIDDGNLVQAESIYSQIIELKPNEEKAWHEKGKILVRTNSCSDAEIHYEKYVALFPDSTRGAEGYDLAKSCI